MPSTNINPTRMELQRLKGRLRTAQRGHKLLKDKRDELMKRFLDVVEEDRTLRRRVEEELMEVHRAFTIAASLMSPQGLEQSLLYPAQEIEVEMTVQNVMSVEVPRYQIHISGQRKGEIFPYGFAQTRGELDDSVEALFRIFPDLLRLAEVEKTSQLLAQEIERTRRRVNALEYVKIPEMEGSVRYITMKLDENERANTIRLMKVKRAILEEAIQSRRSVDG